MNVETYFFEKCPDHREILQQVHQFIVESHPGVRASIKYTVPFYSLKKDMFYLCVQKGIPILGVSKGYLLAEIHHLLDFTNRKQIGHFQLVGMDEQRYTDLLFVIATAVDFDLNL